MEATQILKKLIQNSILNSSSFQFLYYVMNSFTALLSYKDPQFVNLVVLQ